MKIYIIRHGETSANKEGRLQGWSDDPLNEFGIELAEQTGKGMKGILFDAAFSSPLIRARETAEIVLRESGNEGVPIKEDDRIKEICMGTGERKKFRPGECEVDPQYVKCFLSNPIDFEGFPEGESIRTVCERTQDFLKELAKMDYGTVLVATHGCALRAMLNFLYENPSDFWHGHVPYNCVVNIIETEGSNLRLTVEDRVYYDKSLCVDRYEQY